MAHDALDLAAVRPTLLHYAGTVCHAALITSWHDHVLWISCLLAALAVQQRCQSRGVVAGAVVGLLWGIAYNIRSEAMVLFALLLPLSLVFCRLARGPWRLRHHTAAAGVFLVAMVPWALYTQATIGRPLLSTTNGWAVIYYGFGVIPGNRYGIVTSDAHVAAKAKAIGEASPWSSRSNDHFRKRVVEMVSSDPMLLVQRVAWGLATGLRAGPFTPDLRQLVTRTEDDYLHLLYITEDIKRSIGWPGNDLHLPDPRPARPVTAPDVLALAAYAMLGLAFKLTFLAALIWLALLARRPSRLLAAGPVCAYAAAAAAFTAAISALVLPSTRVNSVLLVFAPLLAARMHVISSREHEVTPSAPTSPAYR